VRHEPWKGEVFSRARPCDEQGIILGSLFAARVSRESQYSMRRYLIAWRESGRVRHF
jgi:hypothetical protein